MLEMNGLQRLVEFHIGHNEARFQPRHIGGGFTIGVYAVVLPYPVKRVPQIQGQFGLNP